MLPEPLNPLVVSELKDLLDDGFVLLVERFTDDGRERLTQIGVAIKNSDCATVYSQAHSLKGSSRNVGAEPLAEICAKLEMLGQEQELAGVDELIAAIRTEFAVVTEALRDSLLH